MAALMHGTIILHNGPTDGDKHYFQEPWYGCSSVMQPTIISLHHAHVHTQCVLVTHGSQSIIYSKWRQIRKQKVNHAKKHPHTHPQGNYLN